MDLITIVSLTKIVDNSRKQQLHGGVMFWTCIASSIGLFKIDDDVKSNAENYCKFLENTFFE